MWGNNRDGHQKFSRENCFRLNIRHYKYTQSNLVFSPPQSFTTEEYGPQLTGGLKSILFQQTKHPNYVIMGWHLSLIWLAAYKGVFHSDKWEFLLLNKLDN